MTCDEHERLYELVQNPPPGSKMEAAKEYGVDLTLNLRSLTRTPTERIREMEAALKFAEEWRRAAAHLDLEYTGSTRPDLGRFHRNGGSQQCESGEVHQWTSGTAQ